LCCVGPIDKDLICCFLATDFPTQSTSSSPRSPPPPWHAPGIVKYPAASSACCCCEGALSWVRRAGVGLQHLHLSYSSPWLNLHCKPARPLPKGTCCRPLEDVCRGGTALDMGLQAIRPQNNVWLVPFKDVCQFTLTITFYILGARG